MQVVGLISGGKDSIYNLLECVREGHVIIALANLYPHSETSAVTSEGGKKEDEELDSFCFQSVGYKAIEYIAKAMDLPLVRVPTRGVATQKGNVSLFLSLSLSLYSIPTHSS
jgi:diphthine-ammonia ligase